MTNSAIEPIAGLGETQQAALLDLNNANARETSFLEPDKWAKMIGNAFSATRICDTASLLITFDQDADYDSANFIWFQSRLDRFVYVDRIVVDDAHRGAGVARKLYEDLFGRAAGAGHECIVCEVNRMPPNPGSDAFHTRMGFEEIGQATLAGGDKTVRYLRRILG